MDNKKLLERTGEGIKLGVVLIILLVVMKITFNKEDITLTTRTAASIFWMLVLPGYALLYYWKDKIDFTQRIFVGTAAAAAFIAITSYYLGLAGLNLKYQGIVLPIVMIVLAGLMNWKNFRK